MSKSCVRWTDKEKELLRQLYPTTSAPELAKLLGKTPVAVRTRAKLLKLTTPTKTWTEADIQVLRERYPDTSTRELAEMWGVSMAAVTTMAQINGIGKSAIGLSMKVQHWLPVGSERVHCGRLMRKVQPTGRYEEQWRRVEVITWEEVHGPVPKGKIVTRLDLKAPPILDNLTLFSRAELGRRNNYWVTMPKEEAELYALKGQITRQVNKISRRGQEPSPPSEHTS